MLQRTNAAVDREERIKAVEDLKTRVEDWKGHRIEGFGELLLHGTFTVLKGESIKAKDQEREVSHLFTQINSTHELHRELFRAQSQQSVLLHQGWYG